VLIHNAIWMQTSAACNTAAAAHHMLSAWVSQRGSTGLPRATLVTPPPPPTAVGQL
jgi:hypothetical protein